MPQHQSLGIDSPLPPPSPLYRWIVLMSVSMCFFGGFFGFDALPPIADLLSKQLHFSDSNIGVDPGGI